MTWYIYNNNNCYCLEVKMETLKKFSRKRQAILELLRSTDTHPGAEWIYANLKGRFSDLSLATVYRNLSNFRKDGVIISVGVVNGNERFDAMTHSHAHFVCERCGGVSDLPEIQIPEEDYREILQKNAYRSDCCALTFYGRCGACAQTENNPESNPPGDI
jgi:Fur family peroxide stress response transcriptional regulator